MLRISREAETREAVTLRLEGEVKGPWVAEVRKACAPLLGNGRRLTLDLAEVSFADREGVALLLDLTRRRVRLVNGSPFLTAQLGREGRHDG